MIERYAAVVLAFSVIIIVLDLYLLRKHKIGGKGFVAWFLLGVTLALFSSVPPLVKLVVMIFGTQYTISAVMVTGFLFFTLVIFYLYYRLSELHNLLMKMAMESSVSRYLKKRGSSKSKRKDRETSDKPTTLD